MSKKEISVLCIEDDDTTRNSLVRTLSYSYENVYDSENGLEAVELLKTKDVDVIVTDIKMPKMDGIMLLEYLKEHNINIPVIILSAYDNSDFLHKAIDFKVEKYLNKPINLEKLMDSIDEIKPKSEQKDNQEVKNIINDMSLTLLEMKIQKDFGYVDMNKLYDSIDSVDKNLENLSSSIYEK